MSEEDYDSLDLAFDLPETVVPLDHPLRTLYNILIVRLRREASVLAMNTVQTLLLERIAFNYIVLRHRERHAIGSQEGFASASVQKDFNTFWLSMTKEFNSMLVQANRGTGERETILTTVKDVLLRTVSTIEDIDTRQTLINRLSDEFVKAGL